MDYGPALTNVYEFNGKESNFAYKGIAVRNMVLSCESARTE